MYTSNTRGINTRVTHARTMKLLEAMVTSQHVDERIVAVATAWMNRDGRGLVNNDHVCIFVENGNGGSTDGGLVPARIEVPHTRQE